MYLRNADNLTGPACRFEVGVTHGPLASKTEMTFAEKACPGGHGGVQTRSNAHRGGQAAGPNDMEGG